MWSNRRGFTLIELLVVIAIIAILAAILFPVFASARESARKTACLSNCKQIMLSMMMYMEDFDETTMLSYDTGPSAAPGTDWDWYMQLAPYLKNYQILFCPDRTAWIDVRTPAEIAGNVYDTNNPSCFDGVDFSGKLNPMAAMKECLGYGYNWGPGPSKVGVMSQTGYSCTFASIAYPADTFAFGDTDDTSRTTIKPQFMEQYYTGTTNSGLRHRGLFNMGLMDGHAKAVAFKVGAVPWAPGIPYAFPKGQAWAHAYCADPNMASPSKFGSPAGLTCGQFCDWLNSQGTWYPD